MVWSVQCSAKIHITIVKRRQSTCFCFYFFYSQFSQLFNHFLDYVFPYFFAFLFKFLSLLPSLFSYSRFLHLFICSLTSHSRLPSYFSLSSPFFSIHIIGIISYQLNPVVLAQIVPVLLSVLESPDSDLVVVMTTVSSLGLILQVDGFLRSKVLTPPDIVRTVSVLCLLTTKRLEEEDTKERVITVIRDLLGSLGMSFFSDMEVFSALTYHLTALWGSSDPTSRLRLAIIEVIKAHYNL